MKKLVDVVNLNADASCLESAQWIAQLEGGKSSVLFEWLNQYVRFKKKVVLGIPGASLADIAAYNPEAIELVKAHGDIFEVIVRPFAHDNALLRTRYGFEQNLEFGLKTIKKIFGNYTPFFLPPEFMCNNEQIYLLQKHKINGIFLHPGRFNPETQDRIPDVPYEVRGVMDSRLNCIPFEPKLTKAFLDGIHHYNADKWNAQFSSEISDILFCWRDGESAFLLPDTVAREAAWLENEDKDIERCFLKDLDLQYIKNEELEESHFRSYPIHSFAPWLREMRMIGFTNKVQKIEELGEELEKEKLLHWLLIINSDILSSVEKSSPVIEVWNRADESLEEITLWRTERGFEGEEYLSLLKELGSEPYKRLIDSDLAHMKKFRARVDFLRDI